VQVVPEEKTLNVGETARFKAVGLSNKGMEMPGVKFQWSIEGNSGSVDKTGLFKAENPGQAVVVATANGLTGKARIRVKPLQPAEIKAQPEVIQDKVAANNLTLPDVIMIDNQGFKVRKKGPVKLHHKKHGRDYKVACTECHHVYQGGKNVWTEKDEVKTCISCHHPQKKQGNVDKLQNAYHKNCKTCHKKLVRENKSVTAPYKKCGDCHMKK
ncbi:MAG: Ig-like domain-containing protein, partial [Deltaproteobacteria bacterium]|nr:Ig-like domain-containing protein [Deltaproteobacteria bacterium]